MTHLIDELKIIPGVLGACFFKAGEGVTAANLPPVFKKERLELVGNQLAKIYTAGATTFDDFTGLSLHFDESVIVTRAVAADTLCFVICDIVYSHNVLAMSLDLMQEEISDHSVGKG